MGTMTRSSWTDDDGSGTVGSIINNSELQKVYDNIDTEVKSATSPSVTTKSVIDQVIGNTPGVVLKGWSETPQTLSISANTITLDLSTGNVFNVSLTANISTITVSNWIASKAMPITLRLTQDGTGSRTVAYPAGWKWAGGTAPTITPTPNKTDIVVLWSDNGGTTIFASLFTSNA